MSSNDNKRSLRHSLVPEYSTDGLGNPLSLKTFLTFVVRNSG
jgi:hypothetical protein